jgi:serine/threonine protein kinase
MNKVTKQNVCIKSINIFIDKEVEKQSFANETHFLAGLDHTNIIKFIDHFESDSSFYIVIEFAEWGTLSDLLSKSPEFLTIDVIE